MSISTSYDYKKYSNQITSTNEGHKTGKKRGVHDADSSQELQAMSFGVTQSVSENKPTNPLDALVESGTITSDQKKAIKSAYEDTKSNSFDAGM